MHVQVVRSSDSVRKTIIEDKALVPWRRCGSYLFQAFYAYAGKGPPAVGIVVSIGEKGWQLTAGQLPMKKKLP